MEIPKDLRYTKEHEWARREGDKVVIGITQFAVDQLGDITLVDLAEEGTEVDAGDSCGTVESVKSVSDIYAPLAGVVAQINEDLEDQPELVNDDPYGDGWMLELKVEGDGFDELMDAEAYANLVSKEA